MKNFWHTFTVVIAIIILGLLLSSWLDKLCKNQEKLIGIMKEPIEIIK